MDKYQGRRSSEKANPVLGALIGGVISSTITTTLFQPLELIKTRIQIQNDIEASSDQSRRIFGRLKTSVKYVVASEGARSLWKGTGASLMRSGPGVGLYYALLSLLQSNISGQTDRPDTATQAFYFGLTARSFVSLVLLPITVVKVRYESGRFKYHSLTGAIKSAYVTSNGWVGMLPTVLRDSLFSGTYYMCYTKLKSLTIKQDGTVIELHDKRRTSVHLINFLNGTISGLLASIVTNPIDVVKTIVQANNMQQGQTQVKTSRNVLKALMAERNYSRFFDGLVLRSMRRTLIAATTWTLYESINDVIKRYNFA